MKKDTRDGLLGLALLGGFGFIAGATLDDIFWPEPSPPPIEQQIGVGSKMSLVVPLDPESSSQIPITQFMEETGSESEQEGKSFAFCVCLAKDDASLQRWTACHFLCDTPDKVKDCERQNPNYTCGGNGLFEPTATIRRFTKPERPE